MWLLEVSTRQLRYFEGNGTPKYAILSHRWEAEEVLYQDIVQGTGHLKAGYLKIERSCNQANQDGYSYIWIDTCCIDKKSSAELSEAINSMYRWYQQAQVCYAFLSDVRSNFHENLSPLSRLEPPLYESAWFTRGWTLQELLAPRQLEFYDQDWNYIGHKKDKSIIKHVRKATLIPEEALCQFIPGEWSIAARMSWASKRSTTRVEDQAYCLLGLFQVNIPLLYGEGPNAFLRLQEELCKTTTDRSLFAWSNGLECLYAVDDSYDDERLGSSLPFFAPHVKCFENDFSLDREQRISHYLQGWKGRFMSAIHNDGIMLEVCLSPLFDHVYAATLCYCAGGESLFIYVRRNYEPTDPSYIRVVLDGVWYRRAKLIGPSSMSSQETILIRSYVLQQINTADIFHLQDEFRPHYGFDIYLDARLVNTRFDNEDSTSNGDGDSSAVYEYESDFRPFGDGHCFLYPSSYNESDIGSRRNSDQEWLYRKIRVPWHSAAWWLGCVYYTDADTQALVIITLGLDFDFKLSTIMQVWPKVLSQRTRDLCGFSGQGFGQQCIRRSEKKMIINEFARLSSSESGSFPFSTSNVVDSGETDVVHTFVVQGDVHIPDLQYPSVKCCFSQSRRDGKLAKIYIRRRSTLYKAQKSIKCFRTGMVEASKVLQNVWHAPHSKKSDDYFLILHQILEMIE